MRHMSRSANDVEFEANRYSRHRMVEWFDQDLVSSLKVIVVGAGAIGNEVLKNLALLGVGHITIIDMDHIEIHNLTRSVLFREDDIGASKAVVAAQRIKEINGDVEVDFIIGRLEEKLHLSKISTYDLVFSCLDNFEARLALDEMCLLAGVTIVNGAIDARYASVEIYPYKINRHSGCYSCNLPAGAYHRIAQRYSCGWLRREGLVEKKIPTTIITSSLAASMMVSWALRYPLVSGNESNQPSAYRVLMDSFTGSSSTSVLTLNPECPNCSRYNNKVSILPWDDDFSPSSDSACGQLMAASPTEVVFASRCSNCDFDPQDQIPPGTKLRTYPTTARICPKCNTEAVEIDGRDNGTLSAFTRLRESGLLDIPFVTLNIGTTTFCLENHNERSS